MLPCSPVNVLTFNTQRYIKYYINTIIIRSTAVRHHNIIVILDPYAIFRCILKCV